MNRWLVLACLLACNGNGNGLHDVKNGGDADQDIDQDIDVHEVRAGVFYCMAVSGTQHMKYPCWETSAGCESNRATALGNGYGAGKCEKFPFAFCFHAHRDDDDFNGWDCRRTQALCEAASNRVVTLGYEVSPCRRVPPEGWKKSSLFLHRQAQERRTAGR